MSNYFYLVMFIIVFFIINNVLNQKNIDIQKYLPNIYLKKVCLKRKFKNFISNHNQIILDKPLIYIENFLNKDFYNYLVKQIPNKNLKTSDVYFRKAGGISFEELHKNFDGFVELYYSQELKTFLEKKIQKIINRPPLSDKNCCSLLLYTKKGDFIDWHYDYSSYYGKRITILITLVNENYETGELSDNEFIYLENNVEKKIKCKPNSIVIFDGEHIKHKSTPIDNNQKRVLISMTFCDICQEKNNIVNKVYERIKNMVFY